MSTPGKIVFVAALAVVLAATFYEARLAARQREQLVAQRMRRASLGQELDRAHRQSETDAAALADLQRQLDAARSSHAAEADPSKASANAATQAWLAKLATIKHLLAEHPETNIPELQLLNLRAWLGTIKGLPFDTDEQVRKGLAAIRDAAKREFTMRLSFALQKYLNTRDGELPTSVPALASYFDPPVDAAILERYQMTRTGNVAGLASELRPSGPVVLEKTPVDEDFDARHGVNVGRMGDGSGWGVVQGSFGGIGPAAWIDDYEDRLKRARADFTHDHPGTKSAGLAEVLPYMNPPLDAVVAEKLVKADTAHGK